MGKEFIGEYVWATICLKKQKIWVYYRAKDQDAAVLIKKLEYKVKRRSKVLYQISAKHYDTVRCIEPNQQITLTYVLSPSS